MERVRDFFPSFCLFFKVKWFCFREAKEIRRRFSGFKCYEDAFKRTYRFRNPYRICKEFLRQRGEALVDAYGETPLPVYAQIAQECALTQGDTIFEIGCGRGRGVFFLSHLLGCKVIGIDWVPFFVQTAQEIAESSLPRLPIAFRCEEMLSSDFSHATAIYLYGTCLADEQIYSLVSRFESLAPEVKVITVSYPLSDYSPHFCTTGQFTAVFPWGNAEIYVNSNYLLKT